MGNIKNWKKFNEQVSHIPGPGVIGSKSLVIDDDEMGYFSSEPALQLLISSKKIALYEYELWYYENDKKTISKLSEYFPDMK